MHYNHCEVILFKQWIAETLGAFIGSSLGIFFIAILFEAIRYYRDYLDKKETLKNRNRKKAGLPLKSAKEYMLSANHIVQCFLHALQISIGYWFMLIFMQFNFWLCFVIVMGAVVGYFLFAWMRQIYIKPCEDCHSTEPEPEPKTSG